MHLDEIMLFDSLCESSSQSVKHLSLRSSRERAQSSRERRPSRRPDGRGAGVFPLKRNVGSTIPNAGGNAPKIKITLQFKFERIPGKASKHGNRRTVFSPRNKRTHRAINLCEKICADLRTARGVRTGRARGAGSVALGSS
ncbi:hypothetical protein EVAR_68563_1 [Eumeta japonica]|uniref:Uncharacterized protein n=1 Tax=Eumeta variegata TaxID=151549 RepID=A0A4C1SDC2_EUMVA|nr:hypothetical protein EVAR_68563_1 [Eumeta japonica]